MATPKISFSPDELDLLRKLWVSDLTDAALCERMGRHRGVLRRKAEVMGLAPRRIARQGRKPLSRHEKSARA